MGDALTGLPIGQLGAGALLGLWVLLVMLGKLPTPGQMRDMRQQILDVQADREFWRSSAEKWQEGTLKLGMSMEKVVVLAEATNHALVDIQRLASPAGQEHPS